MNHLMSVVIDLNTERTQLSQQALDLLLSGIAPHIANVLVFIASQNFVNDTCELISDGYLGFIL